ncbi:MAG TPA: response regulator [Labilithrix sp.]|nr:response regulator [Labilithrix sp.]
MQTSVLLVEDNDDVAARIAAVFARSTRIPFALSRVTDLESAKAHLGERRYDAILVDIGHVDGDTVAKVVDLDACGAGAAVVLLTDDESLTNGQHCLCRVHAAELCAYERVVKSERSLDLLPLTIAYACERQRRNDEVRELSRAFSNSVDAIATLDERGRCVGVNAAFRSFLKDSAGEVIGTSLLDLVVEEERSRVAEALKDGHADALEIHIIRKDGRIVPACVSVVARARASGQFFFVQDLTRQQRAESRVASSAAITAVGSLATGLAHEINNPLAVVLANVEEALRVTSDLESSFERPAKTELTDLRAMLEEALEASQRVQFIVRDLRAFACPDERRVRVDLNALAESCCNIAFAEIRHRARLRKELKATAPVLGNEAKIAQMLLHLLVNAAHAMPEGDVEHNEILITTAQHERAAVIEVSDTGSGIAKAHATRVFEPFFTTKPRRPGMGLSICKATVTEHGGEISIHARDGGGTVVRVVLPTLEAEMSDHSLTPIDRTEQQRRVLIVDDDPLVLRSLTRVLARDFEIASARNGREALDLVRAGGNFDAMLCDLTMPELSGIELHELLSRDDPELAKRTVFLTGGAFSGRAQTFLDAVGQPHLEKPVNFRLVRDVLMQLSRAPSEATTPAKWFGRG